MPFRISYISTTLVNWPAMKIWHIFRAAELSLPICNKWLCSPEGERSPGATVKMSFILHVETYMGNILCLGRKLNLPLLRCDLSNLYYKISLSFGQMNIKSKQLKLKGASTTITSINATIQSPPLYSFVKKSKHAWTQKLWTMSTISKYSQEWWQRLQIVLQRISLFFHSALSAWYYSLTISMG